MGKRLKREAEFTACVITQIYEHVLEAWCVRKEFDVTGMYSKGVKTRERLLVRH